MPSLLRFLFVVGLIVGSIYGAVYALANLVQPQPREISVPVAAEKFSKK